MGCPGKERELGHLKMPLLWARIVGVFPDDLRLRRWSLYCVCPVEFVHVIRFFKRAFTAVIQNGKREL